jgi:copper oxidase (laccase) domain-containing protein
LVDCGVDPLQVVVALGPAIGPCCYEVGEEVAREVARAGGGQPARILEPGGSSGAVRIDLRSALRDQLVARGVPDSAIHEAPWCTACTPRLFHSFRRDGERSGRQIAAIGWALGAVA